MMSKSQKSKWIVGISGAAFSAFVISQIGANPPAGKTSTPQTLITKSMSKEEKELVQLDWSNFSINGAPIASDGGIQQSDRTTKRS